MKRVRLILSSAALVLASMSNIVLFTGVARAAADTCTWTGAGGDTNWSTAGNWSGCDNGTVPEAGDALVFPADITNRTANNDLAANTSFSSITFSGAVTVSSSYTITGNAIDLSGGVTNTMTGAESNDQAIDLPIVLAGAQSFVATGATSYMDFRGPINLGSNTLTTSGSGYIFLSGVISGAGNIINTADWLLLDGVNTFTGTVVSSNGALSASTSSGLGSSSAGTTINAGSSLTFCGGGTSDVTVAEPITLNGGGFGLNSKLNLFGSCGSGGGSDDSQADPFTILSGPVVLGSNVEVNGYVRDLKITGDLSGTGFTLNPRPGTDTVIVIEASSNTSGTPNGTAQPSVVTTTFSGDRSADSPSAGVNQIVIIEAGATTNDAYVEGGILKGLGTVGVIYLSSGTVAPGLSPGCLASGNLVYTGGTVEIEVGGTTACSEYDQQVVTGTVDLGSATTLNVVRWNGFYPADGNTFTIINNDGTADQTTGTFTGMAEASTFTQDGVTYRINYNAGDGNDVVLTVVAVPGAPNTGIAQAPTFTAILLLSAISLAGYFVLARSKKSKI